MDRVHTQPAADDWTAADDWPAGPVVPLLAVAGLRATVDNASTREELLLSDVFSPALLNMTRCFPPFIVRNADRRSVQYKRLPTFSGSFVPSTPMQS